MREIHLFSERYGDTDSLPLSLLQWFFSRLNTPVRLGPVRAGNRAVIVTKVVGELSSSDMHKSEQKKPADSKKSGQSSSSRKKEPKTREVDLVLVPESTVQLTFPTYRVVLCLDVGRSVFNLTDAGFPLTVLQDCLLAFVRQLSAILVNLNCFTCRT